MGRHQTGAAAGRRCNRTEDLRWNRGWTACGAGERQLTSGRACGSDSCESADAMTTAVPQRECSLIPRARSEVERLCGASKRGSVRVGAKSRERAASSQRDDRAASGGTCAQGGRQQNGLCACGARAACGATRGRVPAAMRAQVQRPRTQTQTVPRRRGRRVNRHRAPNQAEGTISTFVSSRDRAQIVTRDGPAADARLARATRGALQCLIQC